MNLRRIAFTGTRGHWGVVTKELAGRRDIEVVALADGGDNVAPLVEWCAKNDRPTPAVESDHAAMLDRHRPDAVVICGPFERHADQCVEAIERGIHVLTEKPAALTFDDLARLETATKARPDVHFAGMMFSRYDPGFYTAAALVRGGAIGDVRLINARKSYRLGRRDAYYHDRATYGGTIPWVGSHAIDWVMWFAGAAFESVYASHSAAHNGGNGTMERSAACHFAIAGERAATVSIDVFRPATAPTHGDDWARIVGSTGIIEARPDSITLLSENNPPDEAVPVACDRSPLQDFIDHCDGVRPAIITTADTLRLTDACLRARLSADEQRLVRF
jgi:predicted dehydrogenase